MQVSEKARVAAERRERASKKACAEGEHRDRALEKARAAARAEQSCIHQQVEDISTLAAQTSEEVARVRGMQHTRSEMFEALRHRAGRALGELLGSGVAGPLVSDDAGYLGFFTRVVECLEGMVRKAR